MRIGVNARNLVPGITGIGRYVSDMCYHLALKGHELVLYLPEEPFCPLPDWSGVTIRTSAFTGSARRAIWAQTTLPRLAASDDLDIFWGPAHRLPFLLKRNTPRVVTIHDLVWLEAPSTMRFQTWLADRLLMQPAIESADMIVVDSLAMAKALKLFFPTFNEKVRVVYPGLPSCTINAQDEIFNELKAVRGLDRPYALFVGTLEPRKNLLRLLEAFSQLPIDIQNRLLLVIVGGKGWHLGDLENHIARLRLEPSVRLMGYVSEEELACLYANARFLAMPSLYEGFGFPIIEANASGIPVLTSNSSSMPEVAGDAALLVDPTDIEAIRSAMIHLATDERLYNTLATRARQNADRFNWSKSADDLIAVFDEAIEVRKSSRAI